MPLIDIKAHFACDGCNKPISADLDAGYKPPAGWSIYDCAVDEVRGGCNNGDIFRPSTSVQADMILCPDCTSVADRIGVDGIGDDDYQPTADEIRAALNPE